jgi:hypothetical protein
VTTTITSTCDFHCHRYIDQPVIVHINQPVTFIVAITDMPSSSNYKNIHSHGYQNHHHNMYINLYHTMYINHVHKLVPYYASTMYQNLYHIMYQDHQEVPLTMYHIIIKISASTMCQSKYQNMNHYITKMSLNMYYHHPTCTSYMYQEYASHHAPNMCLKHIPMPQQDINK